MVATQERIGQVNTTEEIKFYSLEELHEVIKLSPIEIIKMLGLVKEVIHPTEDGSQMITEAAFNAVILRWAKSHKDHTNHKVEAPTQSKAAPKTPSKRKSKPQC